MRRRTLLAIPPVGALAWALAACQPKEDPMSEASGDQRSEYGSDPSQFGDLYLPDPGTAPRGVVVVIHGGFWLSQYDLSYGAPLAKDLARRGWIAWNLEYRRVGNGGGVPETLLDVSAGLDHLGSLDLPLRDAGLGDVPLVLLGHSAGGHLAAWVAGPGRDAVVGEAGSQVDVRPTHVISQAGVLDLQAADDEGLGSGAVQRFLGHPATSADADVDPAQQVPLDLPVWCVHGQDDDIVPPSQSSDYVDATTAAGGDATLVSVPGDHFALIDTSAAAWRSTLEVFDSIG